MKAVHTVLVDDSSLLLSKKIEFERLKWKSVIYGFEKRTSWSTPLIASTPEAAICEFEASLIYIMSPGRPGLYRMALSETNKQTNKSKIHKQKKNFLVLSIFVYITVPLS